MHGGSRGGGRRPGVSRDPRHPYTMPSPARSPQIGDGGRAAADGLDGDRPTSRRPSGAASDPRCSLVWIVVRARNSPLPCSRPEDGVPRACWWSRAARDRGRRGRSGRSVLQVRDLHVRLRRRGRSLAAEEGPCRGRARRRRREPHARRGRRSWRSRASPAAARPRSRARSSGLVRPDRGGSCSGRRLLRGRPRLPAHGAVVYQDPTAPWIHDRRSTTRSAEGLRSAKVPGDGRSVARTLSPARAAPRRKRFFLQFPPSSRERQTPARRDRGRARPGAARDRGRTSRSRTWTPRSAARSSVAAEAAGGVERSAS